MWAPPWDQLRPEPSVRCPLGGNLPGSRGGAQALHRGGNTAAGAAALPLPVALAAGNILREVQGRRPCPPMPLLRRKSIKDTVFQLFLEQVRQLLMGASIECFNDENTHWPFKVLDKQKIYSFKHMYMRIKLY